MYEDKVYVHIFTQHEDSDATTYSANFIKFIDAEWQYAVFWWKATNCKAIE